MEKVDELCIYIFFMQATMRSDILLVPNKSGRPCLVVKISLLGSATFDLIERERRKGEREFGRAESLKRKRHQQSLSGTESHV